MSDPEQLTDAELVEQLAEFGEEVPLPLKRNKRPILIKKLNHLRARVRAQETPPKKKAGTTARSSRVKDTPAQEKKRSPQLSDSTLRTLRRRTADVIDDHLLPPPPRRHSPLPNSSRLQTSLSDIALDDSVGVSPRRTRSSIGNHVNHQENTSVDPPSPSPARSRLYPDLGKFISFSSSRNDGFESSDSDPEGSTYEVENKSVNTSFPSFHHGREPVNNSFLSSSYGGVSSSSSFNESPSGARYPHRRRYSGTHRVQQYKSAITEYLPHVLVAVALCFFVTLTVAYVANHKDFFISWFTTNSNMGVNDELLLCPDDIPKDGCYTSTEASNALQYVRDVFNKLSGKKGDVLCDKLQEGEEFMKAALLKSRILKDSIASTNAVRLYECCLDLILSNPHWNLKALRADGSSATTVAEVVTLESKVASMDFWCRLRRSFTTVLYGIFLFATLLGLAALISLYVKYRLQRQEQEQRQVFAMVEKIIEVLQDHHERSKLDDEEPPYLAVQHVRDQLLPPAVRSRQQPIWDKAVEFISANESRIRLETQLIHGDEFDVWHWLQAPSHNGKIWQGQAFPEASENSPTQRMYSPTQCLKIRNMFDSNVESEAGWEQSVIDAILEKCENIEHVVHAFVDTDSQEGCVYIKCTTLEAAGRARQALHGWWFDGRLVTVRHLKTDHYHKRWPESRVATKPLKPSSNQMRSLSQPFHRSSLEMT